MSERASEPAPAWALPPIYIRLAVAMAEQIALILVVVNIYAPAQRNGRQRPARQRPAPTPTKSSATPAVPTSVRAAGASPTSHELQELGSGIALDGRGKLWAVVIGISNYKNLAPEDHLQFAQRDAQEFAAFLRSPR
jgi:hypothetical protein